MSDGGKAFIMVYVQAFYFPAIPLVRDSRFALVSLSPLFRLYSFKIRKKLRLFCMLPRVRGFYCSQLLSLTKCISTASWRIWLSYSFIWYGSYPGDFRVFASHMTPGLIYLSQAMLRHNHQNRGWRDIRINQKWHGKVTRKEHHTCVSFSSSCYRQEV